MSSELEFERPVRELEKKIAELKKFMAENEMDLTEELTRLEKKLENVKKEVYAELTPWDRVQIARHMERPTSLDYIPLLFDDFLECHGDRLYGDDEAIVGGIASFEGQPVTVIGQQRGRDTKENLRRNFGMPHPEGYRKALRLMRQAEKFARPVITLIDTKGAYPGKEAEERGQSEAIARNLFAMAGLGVPIVCLIIGEGASGGALAIGLGDRIHMLENAWFSVISPEGAAALLWKDSSQAKRAAATMKITAPDLKKLGVIDEVIPEPEGGAHRDIKKQAESIRSVLKQSLAELASHSAEELVAERLKKYKKVGAFTFENGYGAPPSS